MTTQQKIIDQDEEVTSKELILGFQKWLRYLWSNWLILVIAGLLGGVLGLWYAYSKTIVYTARTSFVAESGDSKSNIGNLAGMAAMAGINLGGNAGGLFQGDNILELYKSRRMLVKALLAPVETDSCQLLIERFIEYNEIRETWADNPDLLALDFRLENEDLGFHGRRLRDSVLTAFTNGIRKNVLNVSKPDRNLSIIHVDVVSPDEVFAKSFNENLVKEVNEFYIQTKTKKSTDNIAILEAKVDSVRNVMTGAISRAAHTADATPNLNPTRQSQRTVPTQEAQFAAEANRAVLSQLLQNLEVARMAHLQEQPLIQLVDQPVYPLPMQRMSKVKGVVMGGLIAGFLTLLALIALKWYRDVMREDEEEPITP